MAVPAAAVTELPGTAAIRLLDELRELAERTDTPLTPTQLAAALLNGAPDLVMTDLEELLTHIRTSGVRSIFTDDEELRIFYRVTGQRILARMMVLTERTLIMLGQKLERTPLANLQLSQLVQVLNSLTNQAKTASEIANQSSGREQAREVKSTEELRQELTEKRLLAAQETPLRDDGI